MTLPILTSSHRPSESVTIRDVVESQKSIITSLNSLLIQSNLDGCLLQSLTLETGTENHVVHGLDREFIGWYIIDKSGAADVYRKTDSTADKSIYLPLVTNSRVIISIIIF